MNAKTLRTIIANHPVLASICDRIMGDAWNLAVLLK